MYCLRELYTEIGHSLKETLSLRYNLRSLQTDENQNPVATQLSHYQPLSLATVKTTETQNLYFLRAFPRLYILICCR